MKATQPKRAGMHVADAPVGVMRQRVDRADRHHRALERRHAVEADGGDREAQAGIGAQLVPRARQRHQAVDHAAPRRHPQHDRERHAQGLRPVRQRGVVQVMRTSPDVHEDQGPEVHDRQAVGVDRPARRLRNEVVHHPQEARGQEEADRVVAIPPLDHRVLHARGDVIAFGGEEADRHRDVVADDATRRWSG